MGCLFDKNEKPTENTSPPSPTVLQQIEPLYTREQREIQSTFWVEYIEQELRFGRMTLKDVIDVKSRTVFRLP